MKSFDIRPILALTAVFLWASALPVSKLALMIGHPIATASMRFLCVGVISLLATGHYRAQLRSIFCNWKQGLIVAVLAGLQYFLFFTGISMITGVLTSAIVGLAPLVSTLIVPFFMKEDRLSWAKIATLIVALLGVIIASFGAKAPTSSDLSLSPHLLLGMLLLMGGVFTGALVNILAVRSGDMKPSTLVGVEFFFGGLLLLIAALSLEGPSTYFPRDFHYYMYMIYLVFGMVCAFNLYMLTVRTLKMKVSTFNVYQASLPAIGTACSWLFIRGEEPNLFSIIGVLVSTGSVLLYLLGARRH